MTDTISFEKTAKDFSEDKISAPSGGYLLNNSGSTKIAVDQLDHSVYFMTDTMNVGQISPPVEYRMDDGRDAVRILYFKSKTKAHQANLVDDWQKIQDAAIGEKKGKAEQEWFEKSKHDVFVYIDDAYKSCQIMN